MPFSASSYSWMERVAAREAVLIALAWGLRYGAIRTNAKNTAAFGKSFSWRLRTWLSLSRVISFNLQIHAQILCPNFSKPMSFSFWNINFLPEKLRLLLGPQERKKMLHMFLY